jgi:hypothetical protein
MHMATRYLLPRTQWLRHFGWCGDTANARPQAQLAIRAIPERKEPSARCDDGGMLPSTRNSGNAVTFC